MGANFETATMKACSKQELKRKFDELVDRSRIEDGTDPYSGSFGTKTDGLLIRDKTFPGDAEAEDFINEDIDKWGPAIAVKIKVPSAGTQKKIASLQAKINELHQQTGFGSFFRGQGEREVYSEAVKRAKTAKSKFKSCKACGSQVAREHIKDSACPVCHDSGFLLVQADLNRLNTIKAKKEKAGEKIKAYQEQIATLSEQDKSDDYHWFIGALCPS